MKITKFETFRVRPRWLLLRVETDEGYVGWGEPVVEGRAATTEACVHELEPYYIGQDPRNVEKLWETVYRGGFYRGGPVLTSAMSGIDQALWDIKAKALGVPVWELLGGNVRDRQMVYSWIDYSTPEAAAKDAKAKMDAGFKAVKMGGCDPIGWINDHRAMDAVLQKVQAVRDACGPDLGIAVDLHGRCHEGTAKTMLKELEPFNLLFVEEPVLCENVDAFALLHRMSSIPLATGERNFTRWGFRELLTRNCIDIAQPDLCHAGGITEVKKIATMCEAFDVALAPHCPLGPIGLVSCLQIDFTSVNAGIQEQSVGMGYNKGRELDAYVKNPEVLAYKDGYVDLLTNPGLGIEMDEENIRACAEPDLEWKNEVWHTEDGCIVEW